MAYGARKEFQVKDNTLYTENSIVSETPRVFTRRNPSTYLGSSKKNTNLIKEVYANSIDEVVLGHGNIIEVLVDIDNNKYIVKDYGQGFLINAGIDENGKTIMQRSFDTINTSGKTSSDGVYGGSSLGTNGIGIKVVNFLSKQLIAKSIRNGKYEKIWFEDGFFKKREIGKTTEHNGTEVIWYPDEQFFDNNDPDLFFLYDYFEEISALIPNLTTKFTYIKGGKRKDITYHIQDGLNSLVTKRIGDKELFSNRFNMARKLGKEMFSICLTYTSDYSDSITSFVNLGKTDSGEHISAFKSSLTKTINKYAQENNLLKKKEKNLSSSELLEGLYVIFNLTTTSAKYDAQNKSRIDGIDPTIINQTMSGDFATWLMNNQKEANIIIERALLARRVREASKKAKDKIRETSKNKKTSLFSDLPSNLSDCYPKDKDRSKCELMICEGLSAKSSIDAVRDSSFQATFGIRGKILNCQQAKIDKIYSNIEISSIVKALGLEVDKETGKLIYDERKLRYGKLIIATDADADAFSITSLLITVINWLCQDLILKGHVYKIYSALFKATFKDGTYKLFVDDNDFNKWSKKNKKEYRLERIKGLGEMTKDEAFEQLVNPSTRNLKQFEVDDLKEFEEYLEMFEGKEVENRLKYLEEHFNDYD